MYKKYLQITLFILAFIVFGIPNSSLAKPRIIKYHFGVWILKYNHDTFDGTNSCELYAKKMKYQNGVIAFDLGKDFISQDAEFKVNRGQVQKVYDYEGEIRNKMIYESGPLDNPFEGQVLLPTRALQNAAFVEIRASKRLEVRPFSTKGLGDALSYINSHNCK